MIRATKNGIPGVFSEIDWKTGQPQRVGWIEVGKEKKTLPKELVEYAFRKKKVEPEKVILETIAGDVIEIPTGKIIKEKPIKPQKDDHSKPKKRTTGKRNRPAVGKA